MMESARTLLENAEKLRSLDEAFRWGVSRTPRVVPEDVVIQDEYTHDVLFRETEHSYLVFDTT